MELSWIIERFCPFEEKCGRNPIIQSTHVCCCTHLDVSHLTGQTETQLHHLSRKGRAADRCSFKRVVGWGSRMLSCCGAKIWRSNNDRHSWWKGFTNDLHLSCEIPLSEVSGPLSLIFHFGSRAHFRFQNVLNSPTHPLDPM